MQRVILALLLLIPATAADDYFPPPDREGAGVPSSSPHAARLVSTSQTDEAFDYVQKTTKHGGFGGAARLAGL
jgi:hypothetical protein